MFRKYFDVASRLSIFERLSYTFVFATALAAAYIDDLGIEEPHFERIEKRLIKID